MGRRVASTLLFIEIMKEKVIIVLPAYNCSQTLRRTYDEIPKDLVDNVILVDDASSDATVKEAERLGIKYIIRHNDNLGYGANQKTCYDTALSRGADIIIMLHPDYQYTPLLIPDIIDRIRRGSNIVFASRMMKGLEAVRNGMPRYKYFANRVLTIFQNLLLHQNLSEYHTGYRAYRREALVRIDYHKLSDDFIFDNQIILELLRAGFDVDEVYCPARYEAGSSSINLKRSIKYGIGVIVETLKYCSK